MKIFQQKSTNDPIQKNRMLLGWITPDWTRRIIGLLGMAFPLILYIGYDFTVIGSLSAYYHTNMKWIFIGFFLLFGWMLIAYKGFPGSYDDVASIIAGISAIGVGVLRTTPPGMDTRDFLGWLHIIATLTFFIVMTYMAGWLFTLNTKGKWKKIIYKFSALGMITAMFGIFLVEFLSIQFFDNPTFWYEVVAFEFFGIAWFVKGL